VARPGDRKSWQQAIVRHLEDFPPQYAALESAMAAFGDDFDLAAFKRAYDNRGNDPAGYNRVQAVERAAGRIQNYVAELAEAGSKLAELPRPKLGKGGSKAQQAFEALRDSNVINANLSKRLVRAQRARTMIEHSYVRTPAGDVHQAANLVHDAAREFIERYRDWISDYV
jgi:hypothetical protein